MAGCGLIVYRLQEPFIDYYYENTNSDQYFEFFRDPPTHWWCNGLHQNDVDGDWRYFRFVAANDEGEFIYKMNAETFEIVQVTLLEELRAEISKGWDGMTSKRNVKDIVAAKRKASK